MKPLLWTLPAQRDIARIGLLLGEIDAVLASRAIANIRSSSWRLRDYPLSAPQIGASGFRKLLVPGTPYLLIYRVTGDRTEILRVRHAHEDWASQ